jgi:hypothetical protein
MMCQNPIRQILQHNIRKHNHIRHHIRLSLHIRNHKLPRLQNLRTNLQGNLQGTHNLLLDAHTEMLESNLLL